MSGDISTPPMRRSLLVILPVLTFAVLAGVFYARLRSGVDAQAIPSALIGKPVPAFQLDPVPGVEADGRAVTGLSSADLKGGVTVLNFFASWCAPCQIEHPMLMKMAREPGIRVVGIDYKDAPEAGRRYLARNGVPETFIVGPDGVIRDKLVGILTPENYASVLDKVRTAGKVATAN